MTAIYAYEITLPFATFTIEVKRGIVINAAPLARWAVGQPFIMVEAYYIKRGATVKRLKG